MQITEYHELPQVKAFEDMGTMMKKLAFVAVACACALMLVLVGCAGADGPVQSWEQKAFAGTWNLVEMSDGGDVTGADELKLMNSMGMQVTLALGEDSNLTLDRLGKVTNGTWKATSETEGSATIEGQELAMQITEGKLVLEQGGDKLVFEKVSDEVEQGASSGSSGVARSDASAPSAEPSSSSAASSASSSSASAEASSASSASSESEKGSR